MIREFEWDTEKASSNFKKHGIRFEDAVAVFDDPFYISHQDRFENGEYRYQVIGFVAGFRLLLLAHTVRFENNVEIVRIISARKVKGKERNYYANGSF